MQTVGIINSLIVISSIARNLSSSDRLADPKEPPLSHAPRMGNYSNE